PYHDGYAGPVNAAAGSVLGDWVLVDMFARVVTGEANAEDSIRQAVRGAQRYYK
ncbi:MAG: carbohydrate ABC transporter substrate-binding protein, partial [Gemmatimonadaceae bacterium]|nr:carbohydrate ABC transporter substrate-binding protein [Acetobacteraceae bacterium]